jgi:hypothetical protein
LSEQATAATAVRASRTGMEARVVMMAAILTLAG